MAKDYGDIPTVELTGVRHVTISGTKCLCGLDYAYGTIDREGHSCNIAWRNLESISCEKCKELYSNTENRED